MRLEFLVLGSLLVWEQAEAARRPAKERNVHQSWWSSSNVLGDPASFLQESAAQTVSYLGDKAFHLKERLHATSGYLNNRIADSLEWMKPRSSFPPMTQEVRDEVINAMMTPLPLTAYYLALPDEDTVLLDMTLKEYFEKVRPVRATDGQTIQLQDLRAQGYLAENAPELFGRHPVEKGTAIYMSHIALWRSILWHADQEDGSENKWSAVFEADAYLTKVFPEVMYNIVRGPTVEEQDIIFTGHCWETCDESLNRPRFGLGFWHMATTAERPLCTHGYAVTVEGVRKLLKHALPIRKSVDEYIASLVADGTLRGMEVWPAITMAQGGVHNNATCAKVLSLHNFCGGFLEMMDRIDWIDCQMRLHLSNLGFKQNDIIATLVWRSLHIGIIMAIALLVVLALTCSGCIDVPYFSLPKRSQKTLTKSTSESQ